MPEPTKYPFAVDLMFAAGTAMEFNVRLTLDDAARLRKAVHDRQSVISVGDPTDNAVVFDASHVDYFNIRRLATAGTALGADSNRHTGDAGTPRSR